jgi:hypothetical protein
MSPLPVPFGGVYCCTTLLPTRSMTLKMPSPDLVWSTAIFPSGRTARSITWPVCSIDVPTGRMNLFSGTTTEPSCWRPTVLLPGVGPLLVAAEATRLLRDYVPRSTFCVVV